MSSAPEAVSVIGVEHERGLTVLAGRVADRELQEVFAENRSGEDERGQEDPGGAAHFHGAMATTSTCPSDRFTRSPTREPSRRSANSDWYE